MRERVQGPWAPWVALACLTALTAVSACALGGSDLSALAPELGEPPGVTGRDCRPAYPLGQSPTLGELARAGTRGNVALWGLEMEAKDTVELSVRYAEDGRLLWVEAIRSTVAEEREIALETLLLEALDEHEQPDWGVRILVVAGDVERLAPSVICEPEARSAGSIRPNIEAIRDFDLVGSYRFPVRISIDERGRVLDIQLLRRTYSPAIDQFLINYVWNTSFEPKLHDGIALPSTLELNIALPRRRR